MKSKGTAKKGNVLDLLDWLKRLLRVPRSAESVSIQHLSKFSFAPKRVSLFAKCLKLDCIKSGERLSDLLTGFGGPVEYVNPVDWN
jgi:hypothetical protein